jgi:hypothetical protein
VTSVQSEEKNYLTLKKDFLDGVLLFGCSFGGSYAPVYGRELEEVFFFYRRSFLLL